jgi:hypothetical protein
LPFPAGPNRRQASRAASRRVRRRPRPLPRARSAGTPDRLSRRLGRPPREGDPAPARDGCPAKGKRRGKQGRPHGTALTALGRAAFSPVVFRVRIRRGAPSGRGKRASPRSGRIRYPDLPSGGGRVRARGLEVPRNGRKAVPSCGSRLSGPVSRPAEPERAGGFRGLSERAPLLPGQPPATRREFARPARAGRASRPGPGQQGVGAVGNAAAVEDEKQGAFVPGDGPQAPWREEREPVLQPEVHAAKPRRLRPPGLPDLAKARAASPPVSSPGHAPLQFRRRATQRPACGPSQVRENEGGASLPPPAPRLAPDVTPFSPKGGSTPAPSPPVLRAGPK